MTKVWAIDCSPEAVALIFMSFSAEGIDMVRHDAVGCDHDVHPLSTWSTDDIQSDTDRVDDLFHTKLTASINGSELAMKALTDITSDDPVGTNENVAMSIGHSGR